MICVGEEEWSGDAARKMPDAKVWLLVFMVDIYHTCSMQCLIQSVHFLKIQLLLLIKTDVRNNYHSIKLG